jgi:transcriptional regulator with XRE-family HTH domain
MIGYEGKVAKRMIQSYEYKQRPIPAKNIRKLANALDIPVDKLVP